MSFRFLHGVFAAHVMATRGNRSLRDAAKGIEGVSASTLHRLEVGYVPDLQTFIAMCDWMAVNPCEFIETEGGPTSDVEPTIRIEHILRSETALDSESIRAVMVLLTHLIESSKGGNDGSA